MCLLLGLLRVGTEIRRDAFEKHAAARRCNSSVAPLQLQT